MKLIRVDPVNCNWRWGFYQFRTEGRCRAIGFRFPFTRLDLRLWFANAPAEARRSRSLQPDVGQEVGP
jgi:hypothetical protein